MLFIQFIGDPDRLERGAFAGLALANALTTTVEAMILLYLLHRRIGGVWVAQAGRQCVPDDACRGGDERIHRRDAIDSFGECFLDFFALVSGCWRDCLSIDGQYPANRGSTILE